jgi:hypothetical protein
VRGGGQLNHIIEHEVKAKRSNGSGFGPVLRDGATKEAVFLLVNTGEGTLRIDNVEIRGQSPEHFAILLPPPSEIAPGESAEVVVVFDPLSYSTRRANLSIFSSSVGRPRLTVKLAGVGVPPVSAPDIEISGGTRALRAGDRRARPETGAKFGLGAIGVPVEREFTIRNLGGSALKLSPELFFITGASAADYVITLRPSADPIQPGETTSFVVRFIAGAAGARKADVAVISDDPDETPFIFRIVGAGA